MASSASTTEECVLPWTPPEGSAQPVRALRSTLLISSLETLREHGHYPRYLERLDPRHRDAVVYAVAGTWLPMEIAFAHYNACEALALGPDAQLAMYRGAGTRSLGTVLGTAVKLAKGVGVNPWTFLSQLDRAFFRAFQGGSVAVYRLGPKEARAEAANHPLLTIPYFRRGLGIVLERQLALFCRSIFVKLVDANPSTTVAYRASWA